MAITAYWIVPARFTETYMQLNIEVPEVDPTPITSGNLDPEKYYEILTIDEDIYQGKKVVGDRFTGVSKDITGKGSVKEVSSVWPLKTTKFDAVVCATLADGRKIIHIVFKRHFVDQIKNLSGLEDPTDAQALLVARINDSHIGITRESVFAQFPELEGQVDNGDGTFTDILKHHRWTCED
jgi:hypothetical protein